MAERRDRRKLVCRKCGAASGMIRKYGLDLCMRCFKENAERMGFKKYE